MAEVLVCAASVCGMHMHRLNLLVVVGNGGVEGPGVGAPHADGAVVALRGDVLAHRVPRHALHNCRVSAQPPRQRYSASAAKGTHTCKFHRKGRISRNGHAVLADATFQTKMSRSTPQEASNALSGAQARPNTSMPCPFSVRAIFHRSCASSLLPISFTPAAPAAGDARRRQRWADRALSPTAARACRRRTRPGTSHPAPIARS